MVSRAATCKVFLLALLAMSALDLAEGEPEPRRRKGSRGRYDYVIAGFYSTWAEAKNSACVCDLRNDLINMED